MHIVHCFSSYLLLLYIYIIYTVIDEKVLVNTF